MVGAKLDVSIVTSIDSRVTDDTVNDSVGEGLEGVGGWPILAEEWGEKHGAIGSVGAGAISDADGQGSTHKTLDAGCRSDLHPRTRRRPHWDESGNSWR